MNIIVKDKRSYEERKAKEGSEAARRHYYNREIRDGSRFASKAGSKEVIKRALDEAASR